MDARGNTLLTWTERRADGRPVSKYRWRQAGSGWSAVRELPVSGWIEKLGITPHGAASALIVRGTGAYEPVPLVVGTAQPGEAIGDLEKVADGASPSSVDFGLDDAGGAIVAWSSWRDPYAQSGPPVPGLVATSTPGGTFGAPQHVGDFSGAPSAADINAAGAAAVAWRDNAGARVSYRPPGGSFGPPEATGFSSYGIDVALDVGGKLAVTGANFGQSPGSEGRANYAIRSPLGDWSEPRRLDPEGFVSDMFFEPHGALTFLTRRPATGNSDTIGVITVAPDGRIESGQLSSGTTRGSAAAAMNLRGGIFAAWSRPKGDGEATEIVARERGFIGGPFGPETVIADVNLGFTYETAFNDLGQAVVVWVEYPPAGPPAAIRVIVRDDPALLQIPPPPDIDIYSDPLAQLDDDGDLLATVRCNQNCKVKASGIVFPGAGRRAIAGGDKSRRLKARTRSRVKLDFGTAGAAAAREALAAGQRPWVSVSVSARGRSPRPFVVSRRFKLKR
jgi:hypothetical protein